MVYTFFSSPATGKAGIFSGTDEAVLDNSLANLSAIKADFNLNYIGSVATKTGSINLDNSTWPLGYEIVLAPHDQSYTPMIIGTITIAGNILPINQTIFVGNIGINIGCDDTNIIMSAAYVGNSDSGGTFVPFSVASYSIEVCNVGVTTGGAYKGPDSYDFMEVTPTRFRCAKYDSNNSYLYKNTSGLIPLPKGRTTFFGVGTSNAGGAGFTLGIRQNINGHFWHKRTGYFDPPYSYFEGTTSPQAVAFVADLVNASI